MSTMPSKTFFPEFVPNQILTNVQLNDLREYLDDQNRLTRVRLTGTGIVCGLEAQRIGNEVHITEGFGITSDGYIIEIPARILVAKRNYIDPNRINYVSKIDDTDDAEIGFDVYGPAYRPWRLEKGEIDLATPSGLPDDPPGNPVTQIPITELITQEEADNDINSENLTNSDFDDHVLVLYLEILKEDLKSCLTTDCNNKGQNLAFTVQALLIHQDEFQPVVPCDGWSNPVFVPRYHRALQQIGVGNLEDIGNRDELNSGYGKIVTGVAAPIFQKIEDRYDEINPFLQLNLDIPNLKNEWNTIFANADTTTYNQYHYDFMRDIACAYNEFVAHYCKIIDVCCPQLDFPRHLMLRDFDGAPEPYRNNFSPSPVRNVMHHDLEKAKRLFRRLEALILNFNLALAEEIKITPSHTDRYTLGEKAIPHYYETSLKETWQPEACCRDPRLLSYETNTPASIDAQEEDFDIQEFLSAPLATLIDKSSFFRIEGHLGKSCQTVLSDLEQLKMDFNLDFNLKLLHLDAANQSTIDNDPLLNAIKSALKEIDEIKLKIEQIIMQDQPDVDSYNAARADLADRYKKIESIQVDWARQRLDHTAHCDLTQVRSDYLLLRSRAICTYSKVKKMLDSLPDLDRDQPNVNSFSARHFEGKRAATDARMTEVNANLKDAQITAEKKQKLELELAHLKVERANFVRIETSLKVGANVANTIRKRTAARATNVNTFAAASFVAEDSADFGQLVTKSLIFGILNIREDIEKLCEQLPKDVKEFNYCLFKYHYKNLIVSILEIKLLLSILLDFLFLTIGGLQPVKNYLETYVLQWLGGHLTEITDFINCIRKLQYNCFQAEFATVYYTTAHLLKSSEASFQNFAAANRGMEHVAGIERGNTFLLVCDQDEIVADFTLHSSPGCCCDFDPNDLCLPPIASPDYKVIRIKEDANPNSHVFVIDELIDVLPNDYNLNNSEPLILELSNKKSELVMLEGGDDNLEIEKDQDGKQRIRYQLRGVAGALDSFKYQLISKTCGLVDEGEVLVLIRPESERPIITQGDIAATAQDQPINIDVALNDFGQGAIFDDNYSLSLDATTTLFGGSVSVQTVNLGSLNRPALRYTPPKGFTGQDTFLYKIQLGGREAIGQVTVLIVPCCDGNGNGGGNTGVIITGPDVIGVVKDASGEPLIGSTILVKGTTTGTVTDIDGKFTLDLPPGQHTLVVSYVGFQTREIEIEVRNSAPSKEIEIILGQGKITGFVAATDLSAFVAANFKGDDLTIKDPATEVITTFDARHTDRLAILETARTNEVVKTTEAFEKADIFIAKSMVNADKTPEALAAEYEELTAELIDAHKLSSGDNKKAYKALLEATTHAYLDKMVIKNPVEAEPTMKVAFENAALKIKGEGIALGGIKRRFKGSDLTKKLKIEVVKDLNKLMK